MVKIVKNDPKYWSFILELRNKYKDKFGNTSEIETVQHFDFMKNYGDKYKIALINEEPVGFIGVVYGDIRICVKEEYQKRGIGKILLQDLIKNNQSFNTKIRIDNEASLNLFESCGFKRKWIILEN